MNRAATIAGFYCDAKNVYHGFVRAADGTITTFDAPGAGTGINLGTLAWSINTAGVITGFYRTADAVSHGFVRAADGAVVSFDATGAGTAAGQGTNPVSINAAGAITGSYIDASGVTHGFLRTPNGTNTSFDAPGATATLPNSINAAGLVAGYCTTVDEGFVRGAQLVTFHVGGKFGTWATSVGDSGAVTGYYIDDSDVPHGFLLTP